MRKLLLLGTGGTIACMPGPDGLAPAFSAKELLPYVEDVEKSEIECCDLFALDSSNIQPEEWHSIGVRIKEAFASGQGVVVTHGTDTMAYTASMLSFILQGATLPVVITGSQFPMAYPDSDGRKNLKNAIIAARSLPGGVYICFGDAVMLGCRAVKVRTTSLHAFESINYPYVGTVAQNRYIPLYQPPFRAPFRYNDSID
ncbi:MAG: asparaginase domain-containing protein, partial [Eubacteriales bacterium]|nr:asparaginase domain-containing protein [Eubacteriales bacterium]